MRELVLGHKAYHRIPHLPGSRTGPADRSAPHDTVVVEEKLDGSCVAVARVRGELVALGREGWRAALSANPGRRMFARWMDAHRERLEPVVREGEWLVGEWLAQVHSIHYRLAHPPFVALELFTPGGALAGDALDRRLGGGVARPARLHLGEAIDVASIDARLGLHGHHGAVEPAEGAVWRLLRAGRVVSRAKYVRPGKRDGVFLPENTGRPPEWNFTDGAEGQ